MCVCLGMCLYIYILSVCMYGLHLFLLHTYEPLLNYIYNTGKILLIFVPTNKLHITAFQAFLGRHSSLLQCWVFVKLGSLKNKNVIIVLPVAISMLLYSLYSSTGTHRA